MTMPAWGGEVPDEQVVGQLAAYVRSMSLPQRWPRMGDAVAIAGPGCCARQIGFRLVGAGKRGEALRRHDYRAAVIRLPRCC